MRLALLSLLCLVITSQARAQIPAAWQGLRVVDLQVLGEASGRVRQRDLGIPIGAPLSRALVRNAVQRLARQGGWADIQVDAVRAEGGVRLLVTLAPELVVQRVDIVGNTALDDRELGRLIGLKPDDSLERELVPSWVKAVEERYERAGYRECQARVLLRSTPDPARRVVRVEIEEGLPTRISGVVYVGEPLSKRKGLRRAFGMRRGDVLDLDEVEAAVERAERQLRNTGYYSASFGKPEYVFRGRTAQVRVPSVVGPKFEVQLAGVGPLKRSEVFEALKLGEERLSGSGVQAVLRSRVRDVYRRRGYNDVQVKVWIVPAPDADTPALLRVRIKLGVQTEVLRATFPGASHFRQSYLREQLFSYLEEDLPGSTLERPVDAHVADRLGLGGQRLERRRGARLPVVIDPRHTYYEDTYDEAIEHLRELYRAQGYLRVQVGPVRLQPLTGAAAEEAEARGVRGVLAAIAVSEGPRTFVYDVAVDDNVQLSDREVLLALSLKRGEPFSYLGLEEARVRLLDAYRERGFYYARAEPRVRFSQDGTRAEIRFEVVERYPVRVGGVEIRGAERSSERMIRNRLAFKLGGLYTPSRERASKQALDDLDIFTTVTIAPDEIDLPARVKTVVVTVSEARTQQLDSNVGFSTGEGARGGFGYRYKNLLGSALRAELRAELGYQFVFLDQEIQNKFEALSLARRLEYQTTLSLGIPYIPYLPRLQTTIDFVVLQDLQREFRMQKEGLVWTLFYRITPQVTVSLAEELEQSNFQILPPQGPAKLDDGETADLETDFSGQGAADFGNLNIDDLVPSGENTLLSTKLTLSWDRRDPKGDSFGALMSASVEYATTINETEQVQPNAKEATLTTSNMFRITASAEFLIPTGRRTAVLINPRWGRVVHLDADSESYPNRRFYLGGVNFRGFQQNQMVPQDLEDLDLPSRGIVSRGGETFLAVQSEFRFPLVGLLQGAVLTDVGNVWLDPKGLDPTEFEPTVGLGLRIDMNVALLALDYGVPLRTENGSPGAFQFSFRSQ